MSPRASHFPTSSRRRWLAALGGLALALGLIVTLATGGAGAQIAARPVVDLVTIDGEITPPMAHYVTGAITAAGNNGANAIVIQMNTPGGLMSAMDDIVGGILDSRVPVIVYVAPQGARAASAGVYITYAAHVAAMAPATRIGSASPVTLGPNGQPSGGDATMNAKITNDAVSQIRNLATLRGRNADWAEQAVRQAANITADEAVKEKVVDLIAPDLPTLLNDVNGRSVTLATGTTTLRTADADIRPVDMGLIDQFLHLLSDPTIAYILLSLGSLGLFFELANPGAVFPGVIGGICLLLGLYTLGTLPVNWTGLLLIGFAFVLFIADLFVPSFGVLTIGGIVSFVLGSYLLLGQGAPPGFQIAPAVIWTMTVLLVLFFLFIGGSVLAARFRKPKTGREALIDSVGTVRQPLAPDGVVFIGGELWQATAAADIPRDRLPIPVNTPVILTKIDGLRAIVRPATPAETAASGVATIGDRRLAPEAKPAPEAAPPAPAAPPPTPTAPPMAAPEPTHAATDVPERSPA
jgi:membrane-bound serine protease (ClpP class)